MRASRVFLPLLALACTPAAVPTSPTGAPSAVVPANVDTLIARLSVKQKVAQLVMPFLPGSYASADDSAFLVASRWVDSLEVGGVIVSVGSPYDIALKLNNLQRRSKLPLLVSADLEWGAGMRLNGGTTFTPIMSVGATGNPLEGYTLLWVRLQDDTLHVYSLAIDDRGGFALDHSTGHLAADGLVTRYVLRLENDRIVTVEGRLERAGGCADAIGAGRVAGRGMVGRAVADADARLRPCPGRDAG